MTDLITEARELIKALHAGEYDDEYIGTGAYLMLDELCDALEKYRWIPVAERLPEEGQPVKVCRIDEVDAVYEPTQNQFNPWRLPQKQGTVRRQSESVTHWMPLPTAPPKEG